MTLHWKIEIKKTPQLVFFWFWDSLFNYSFEQTITQVTHMSNKLLYIKLLPQTSKLLILNSISMGQAIYLKKIGQ